MYERKYNRPAVDATEEEIQGLRYHGPEPTVSPSALNVQPVVASLSSSDKPVTPKPVKQVPSVPVAPGPVKAKPFEVVIPESAVYNGQAELYLFDHEKGVFALFAERCVVLIVREGKGCMLFIHFYRACSSTTVRTRALFTIANKRHAIPPHPTITTRATPIPRYESNIPYGTCVVCVVFSGCGGCFWGFWWCLFLEFEVWYVCFSCALYFTVQFVFMR